MILYWLITKWEDMLWNVWRTQWRIYILILEWTRVLRVKWHCYVFANSHGLYSVSWIHDKYPCLYTAQLTSHRNQICLFVCKLRKSFNLSPSKGNLSRMVLNKKIFAWFPKGWHLFIDDLVVQICMRLNFSNPKMGFLQGNRAWNTPYHCY